MWWYSSGGGSSSSSSVLSTKSTDKVVELYSLKKSYHSLAVNLDRGRWLALGEANSAELIKLNNI